MKSIKFCVFGEAKPAGSKRGFAIYRGKKGEERTFTGKVALIDANPKAKEWKQTVAASALMAYTGRPLEGPIFMHMTFYKSRPKSHYTSKGLLKPSAPRYPTTRPDCGKLARGIQDALSKVIYCDDSQIVNELHEKIYAERDYVDITIMYDETTITRAKQ